METITIKYACTENVPLKNVWIKSIYKKVKGKKCEWKIKLMMKYTVFFLLIVEKMKI